MVSNHEFERHRQFRNAGAKVAVRFCFAAMREIACDDAYFSVSMMLVDVLNAGLKSFDRIEAMQSVPTSHEMWVCNLDEFH